MRKQYYFRQSPRGLLAWDVDRLIRLTSTLPIKRIPLTSIRELDEPWSGDEAQTWREMALHLQLIDEADLTYPIILARDGAVMDGMHRVMKALRQGASDIAAVQLDHDPEPDYVDRNPDELPY